MARLIATVAVFLFLFLFYSTYAHDLSRTLPDPETETETKTKTTPTILLPSQKPESVSEPATVVEWETVTTESKFPESAAVKSSEQSTEKETDFVPLTIVSFRPINRRFPQRPMLPFRRHHRCRHHHRELKPGPGFLGREIPYGDDMILSGFKDVNPDPRFHGGARQIPARWMTFYHDGARFPHMRRPHHREWEEHVEEEKREEHHDKQHHHDHHDHEDGGLMKRVRKFLNHF